MPTKEELIQYYNEKIRHIEDQIRNIEDHIHRLDAFESSEIHRNLPNEYKAALHTTISKAKNDAGIAKQKSVAVANNLKSRIHAFMQKPNGGK